MKRKLYGAGSKMLEKIEHQEVFLKGIPAKEDIPDTTAKTMVPLEYPSALKEAQVRAEFATFIEQRVPYHRKYMILSALCVPVTSLFTIVPLVPNIPFFYNAFRLWSHWKAYSGAKHLAFHVKNGSIHYQACDVLNLGLQHDPEFAVFFTGSHQLSKRRRAFKKYQPTDEPIIAESSGELTPDLQKPASAKDAAATTTTRPSTATAVNVNDPLSVTDHVVNEGFISDAEIQTICLACDRIPMQREIQRARHQEADKYVKERLTEKEGKKA
ncbi:hypothetical protein BG006_006828 [Podila minutissima]|uniref:Uncharacterized protein n=1 Tax=Podila minutissima TaxID=64525 RepID=A0A9P5SIS2_9FUNG|nr:hypothetical protein BG006_006828 [Podila minutissima]